MIADTFHITPAHPDTELLAAWEEFKSKASEQKKLPIELDIPDEMSLSLHALGEHIIGLEPRTVEGLRVKCRLLGYYVMDDLYAAIDGIFPEGDSGDYMNDRVIGAILRDVERMARAA